MSQYKELLLRRNQLQADGVANLAEAVAEGRALTDEERARDDVIQAQLVDLDELITRQTALLDRERASALDIPDGAIIRGLRDLSGELSWLPPIPVGASAVLQARARDIGFGSYLQAVFRARVHGQVDPRLEFEAAAQGAGIADGSSGGFLVPETFSNELALRVTAGEILRRVNGGGPRGISGNTITINVTDETSRATGSRFGGVQGYWIDEGTAPTASRPRLSRVRMELSKIACLGYATDELLADTGGFFGSFMSDSFAQELRFLAEDAVLNGTGAGQPQGLLNAAAIVSVAKETGQAAKTIVRENIDKMWTRMYAPSRASGVWLINQDIEPQLEQLSAVVGTGGVPIYLPPGGINDTPNARLKGRPVVPVEYCATLGTVGDILLVDLSTYLMIESAAGVQGASSMHVAFTTDEMAFRLVWRLDGEPMWRSALTPFKGSDTQSPYISLATRA